MYTEKVLSNGIRVAAEYVPYVRSVSIGIWVGNGSRYERAEENGMSHFIEHMVFKGTHSRTAHDIALEMDSVGAQLNAFTTRECTCFYAKTLNEYVEKSIDILSDMVFSPLLGKTDMDLERRVVLEEIAMYEDSPEDVVYDLYDSAVWGSSPMGRPILGTPEVLYSITPDSMREYMRTHYTSKNIVIAIAGCFDKSLFGLLEKYIGSRHIADNEVECETAHYRPGRIARVRDFEQVQLVAGFRGIDICDESVYSLLVFNSIFGSGMSSRLFQNIREKYGLAYNICAGHTAYIGAGTFDITAAAAPENVEKLSELAVNEIKRIKAEKLTDEDIRRAKIQLKGSYIMSNESIGSRMQSIGRAALLDRPHFTQEEIIEKIETVGSAEVSEMIDKILDTSTLSVAVTGPIDDADNLFLF